MNETIPIACTLAAPGLAAQAKRWEQLIARAMTGRAETEEGLRLCFGAEAEDELRALVAVEIECCAWATWTVERTAGEVVLDIRSTAEAIATLHHMLPSALDLRGHNR